MHARGIAVLFLTIVLVMPGGLAVADHVQTFVPFDPAAAEFPEGIAVDRTGNVHVSLMLRDEIVRVEEGGARNLVAGFAPGTRPVGLAFDAAGTLYAAAAGLDLTTLQTDPATRGVYRVGPGGSVERLVGTGQILFPNDIAFDKRGTLYVTDSEDGAVWRIPRDGSAELWVRDGLLAGTGDLGFGFLLGANGIAVRQNRVVVANTELGLLVEIPIRPDGSPGEPTTLSATPALEGVDGIALDVHGNIYAATALQNTVIRVRPDGSTDTLATAGDGLNQPSTLAFGTSGGERRTLYVANFSLIPPDPTPAVLTLPAGHPGQPLP